MEANDKKIILICKIRLRSAANISEHWSKARTIRIHQQKHIWSAWKVQGVDIKLPVLITLTRMAPRTLDDDNLVTAFKSIRDIVADLITPGLQPGRADNKEGIKFAYSQEKNKQYSIRITLEPPEE